MSAAGFLLASVFLAPGQGTHPDTVARVVAVERARSTMVAVTVLIPQGSGSDPDGKAGAAWLLAHALAEDVNRRLSPLAARVTPHVLRSETTFTLLGPRTGWQDALRRLNEVLFEEGPDPEVLEEVRRRLLDQLRFEEDAPVRAFQQEVDNLLFGSADSWSRPIRGNAASVSAVTAQDLERLHRRLYRSERAVVAAVGPGAAEIDHLVVPGSSAATPPSPPSQEPAWLQGDRLRTTRDVTSTWVAVAYPLAPGLPATQAEFLRAVLAEDLVSTPPDPWLFGAQVRIEQSRRSPFLVVSAAVMPETAPRWEAQVLEGVSTLAGGPVEAAFFGLQRRRFRSAALLDAAHPEFRSEDVARDLARGGAVRDLAAEIDALRADDLWKAAAGLGPPRVLVFGPDVSEPDSDRARLRP